MKQGWRHKIDFLKALLKGFGVLFVFSAGVPVFAGPTASLGIRVNVADAGAPQPVSDMAGSASVTEGEVILTWTAPDGNNPPTGQTVQTYLIKYSTFSVDSLLGDATAWWIAASSATGLPSPQAPGSPETFVINGLEPGATYYFAIRSVDNGGNISPIDTKSATPGQQAQASPRDDAPPAPTGLSAVAGNGQITISWNAVSATDFDYYRIEADSTAPRNFADAYVVALTTSTTYLNTGLTNGNAYAYRIFAVDKGAPSNAGLALETVSTSTVQAVPVAPSTDTMKPAAVAGLLALVNSNGSFGVDWTPVARNEDGTTATDIAGYRVYLSSGLFGPYNVMVSSGVGASATGFSGSAAPAEEFYLVVAVDAAGNESSPGLSNLIHVTPTGLIEQIGLAPDGTMSRASLPDSLMKELKTTSGEMLLRVRPNADPLLNADTQRILKTYNVEFSGATANATVDNRLVLSRPMMSVVLQYAPVGSTPLTAGQIGVLWWNGSKWIKISADQLDPVLNTISFRTALPGVYQVRRYQAATELTLDKSNVFPRIFSPNGDGVNDFVLFVIENPKGSPLQGRIYDLSGAEVANMQKAGAGAPTPDTMMWDGKDRTGRVVPAGVYVYQIKGEGKIMDGTIVVAK